MLRVREEESSAELGRVACEFDAWLELRSARDEQGLHRTQLDALGRVAKGSLTAIKEGLAAIPAGAGAGEVYERCRRADRQVVFVRRLWSYFRERWDQRDDEELGPVLAAADEIVWSCYAPPFKVLGTTPGAAPLAHIADEFSPHATERSRPPAPLRPSDELLGETLAELPIPTIAMPHVCVTRPWWLVLLAHEVGHQVAHDLDGGSAAIAAREAVESTASDGASDDWSRWSDELFADAYAAATVGSAHAWALGELERGEAEAMLSAPRAYPPPLLRHELAAHTLAALGLENGYAIPAVAPPPAVEEVVPDEARRVALRNRLGPAPAVAQALVREPLAGKAALTELTGWKAEDLSRGGKAGWWRKQLASAAEPTGVPALDAARLATVGALGEWTRIAADEDEGARAEGAKRLRERMLRVVPRCREEGVRAAEETAAADVADLATRTAERVLALPADEPVEKA